MTLFLMKTFIPEGIVTTLNDNLSLSVAKTSISIGWTLIVHRYYIVASTLS